MVTEVGSKVTKFKTGDKVGVGCLVGSCGSCQSCTEDLENYCPKCVLTYAVPYHDGTMTYGGYANDMVCSEHFVIRIPENMPLDGGAPLLCAGITVYSPMKFYGLDKPGTHIGVVGLGGLGHVAVKFAKAFGAKVTVISSSEGKRDEAIKHLGADEFLVSRDPGALEVVIFFFCVGKRLDRQRNWVLIISFVYLFLCRLLQQRWMVYSTLSRLITPSCH